MRWYEPADVHALFFCGDGDAVWPVASTGAIICRARTVGATRIGNERSDRDRLRQLERFHRNVPRYARNNAEPVLRRLVITVRPNPSSLVAKWRLILRRCSAGRIDNPNAVSEDLQASPSEPSDLALLSRSFAARGQKSVKMLPTVSMQGRNRWYNDISLCNNPTGNSKR